MLTYHRDIKYVDESHCNNNIDTFILHPFISLNQQWLLITGCFLLILMANIPGWHLRWQWLIAKKALMKCCTNLSYSCFMILIQKRHIQIHHVVHQCWIRVWQSITTDQTFPIYVTRWHWLWCMSCEISTGRNSEIKEKDDMKRQGRKRNRGRRQWQTGDRE